MEEYEIEYPLPQDTYDGGQVQEIEYKVKPPLESKILAGVSD